MLCFHAWSISLTFQDCPNITRSPALRSLSKTPPTKITKHSHCHIIWRRNWRDVLGKQFLLIFLRANWRFPIWILKIKVVVTKWIGHGSDSFCKHYIHYYMATTIPPKNLGSTLKLKHPILVIARHGLHKRWRSMKCRLANGRLEKFRPWN